VPIERDADAAATALRRELNLRASEADLQGPFNKLYSADWPASERESLPLRLLAYSLFHPQNFDTACRSSSTFAFAEPDDLLEELISGASKVRTAVGDRYKQRALDALALPQAARESESPLTESRRNLGSPSADNDVAVPSPSPAKRQNVVRHRQSNETRLNPFRHDCRLSAKERRHTLRLEQ